MYVYRLKDVKRELIMGLDDQQLANISEEDLEDYFKHLKPGERDALHVKAEILVEKKRRILLKKPHELATIDTEELNNFCRILTQEDADIIRYLI